MIPDTTPPPCAAGRHFSHWPPGLPRHLTWPHTHLFQHLEDSAARFPDKPFVIFCETPLSYARFKREAEHIAGFLQQVCGVKAGDRVLLCMQNCPQWMLACHGIVRAGAVVVPASPMLLAGEIQRCIEDSGATVAFVAQEVHARLRPRSGDGPQQGLRHKVVATYSDHVDLALALQPVPAEVGAARQPLDDAEAGTTAWCDMMALQMPPRPLAGGADDACVMPYTSGTTGQPKGCLHTHRSVTSTMVGGAAWFGMSSSSVALAALPLFHVTGLTGGMNTPLHAGASVVLLPRWDREAAAKAIERHRVTHWQAIAPMLSDFLAHPRIDRLDLSSLQSVRGGGIAMPAAVADRLHRLTGLRYVEGYGLSETMGATHLNPPHRPKPQCLGIPVFDVDARVIDPLTLKEMPSGQAGEIVLHGPQVMAGHWQDRQADEEAFVTLQGKRFLRTGDLASIDQDGYFFMIDRLKRIINSAGFKVSPTEVEAWLCRHPAILEACVIASPDPRRGEAVKALVVLRPERRGKVKANQIVQWARARMAAYKAPRAVTFVEALPKSASGKVLWQALQDEEIGKPAFRPGSAGIP